MREAALTLLSLVTCALRLEAVEVHLVGTFVKDRSQLIHYEIMKPVLELAVEEANKKFNSTALSLKLTMVTDSDSCFYTQVAGLISQIHYGPEPIDALFGPACEVALDQASRMAAYWKIPIFTAGGWDVSFSDKDLYPTLTRLSYSLDRITDFFFLILKEMDWHHLAVLTDEREITASLLRQALTKNLAKYSDESYPLKVTYLPLIGKGANATLEVDVVLKEAAKSARIIILLVPSAELIRDILLTAYDLGWSNGHFAFIAFELLKSKSASQTSDQLASGEISWYKLGSRRNKEAKVMFEALNVLKVRVDTNQEFNTFAYKIAKKASADSNGRRYSPADINPIVAAFYDSVMLYASAFNQSLYAAKNSTDGHQILTRIWDKTFYDAMSGDLVINSNGDREADYIYTDLDPESGSMIPVAVYYGSKRSYEKYPNVEIRWPGPDNSPPADRPRCGFQGEDEICAKPSRLPFILLTVGIIFVISSSGASILFFMQRKIRQEAELNDLWWKLDRGELEMLDKKAGDGRVRSAVSLVVSNVSLSARSVRSGRSGRSGSATNFSTTIVNLDGIDVANFRGTRVAVKEMNLMNKVHVTRDLLVQMKSMRECQMHDNLVNFYGLVVEEPCCMVLELCSRGSLRDILENESMTIDWIFRYSIMSDVVEGMYYLHQSPIEYHGRLKSTNLLVDGRFTVKIADYGLRFLYNDRKTDSTNPRTLFWTAPEHLRSRDPLSSGSQKGDVYSFAIICQELITRQGPFEPSLERRSSGNFTTRNMDPDEILDRVRMGGLPPFRPEVTADDCIECPDLLALVRKCWDENPTDRPEFGRIKITLRKLCKGASSKNFLDNLLKRMDQYSTSLEMIVNEKTQGLMAEKAQAEELIYQMLPKFIAEELKLGKHVAPETFDSVTIFFSEILGFKEWTVKSSPTETIDLLNEIYATIDEVIGNYNVYKVETVTDQYLIASGLPVRNGNEHAREISRMALDLRIAIRNFMQKKSGTNFSHLAIRMGFHSGSCVTGVIGLKMPKYCLFGDTINTASRMETTGEAGKIQISAITKSILDLFGNFIVLPRGEVEVKGKGKLKTFWLEGEDRSFK